MGFKGNVSFLRLLQTLGAPSHRNFLGAFEDFAAGSTSCAGDSSAFIFSAEGAMAASLFGSSSSLQRKPKERDFTQLERRKTSKKKHRVGKILTSPRGRKVLPPF
jgi:hypothetical protein